MTTPSRAPAVGVGCIVMREGRILLVRDKGGLQAGSWGPPGGYLDFGESPQEGAAREVQEETGLRVTNVTFVTVTNDIFDAAGRHSVTLWMRAEALEGEPRIADPSEIADVGWFELALLPTPLYLSFENLLAGRCIPTPPADLFQY